MYNPSYNPARTAASGQARQAANSWDWMTGSKQQRQDYFKNIGFNYNGDNEIKPMFNTLAGGYYPGAAANVAFSNELNGRRQSAIRQLLDSLSTSGQQAQMRGLQNQAMENGTQAARQAALMNRSSGLGDGFQAGNTAGIMGQAAMQQNQIAREYASPQHQQQGLAAILQAISAGYENPEMNALMQLYGPVFSSQQYNNQQAASHGLGGFLGQIAPYAGMAAGMPGVGNFFSGLFRPQRGGVSYGAANNNYAGTSGTLTNEQGYL